MRLLPDWETLPYDTFSPHRISCPSGWPRCTTSAKAAATSCSCPRPPRCTGCRPRRSWPRTRSHSRRASASTKLKAQLTLAGYEHVSRGRAARRILRARLADRPVPDACRCRTGSTCSTTRPTRSARSTRHAAQLYPVRDVRLPARPRVSVRRSRAHGFRSRWRETFEGDPSRAPIYKDIGNGVPSAGIEYYLPLFFDETATLFHYLPQDAHLVFTGDLEASIRRFTADTKQRHAFSRTIANGRSSSRSACSCPTRTSSRSRSRSPASCCPRSRPAAGRRRCPSHRRPPCRRSARVAAHVRRIVGQARAADGRIGRPARDDPATARRTPSAPRVERPLRRLARERRTLRARRRAARERLRGAGRRLRGRHRNRAVRRPRPPHAAAGRNRRATSTRWCATCRS